MMYGYGGGWIGMVVGLIVTVVIIIGVVDMGAKRRAIESHRETAQDIAQSMQRWSHT